MKNVFCDICGSAYPENESCCPVCGSSREFGMDTVDAFLSDELEETLFGQEQAAPRKKSREIFDYDEVNPEEEPEEFEPEFDDEEAVYEEPRKSNAGLVVILLILIVMLLATAGYLYLRFFLPNMPKKEAPGPTTVATEPTTLPTETVPVETGVPCTDIVLVDGKFELGEGGKGLLNVKIYPEDTTDTLEYTSSDETVVTVDESGTLTAVGEGEATITVTCGSRSIKCHVLVDYSIKAEVDAEGTLPSLEVEGEETEPTEETTGETTEETTDETEATEETKPEETEVTLKLKKNDITIFSNHTSVRLELEGDVDPAKLKWFTMDSTVAIVHDGVVTSTGSGITRIYGEYDGQQVECVVRCNF